MSERTISDLFEPTFNRIIVAIAMGISVSSIARMSGVRPVKIHRALGFFRGSEAVMKGERDPASFASRLTDRELMMIQRVLVQLALTLSASDESTGQAATRILEQEKQMGVNLKKAKRKRDLALKEVQKNKGNS
ncbi:MAG: hypothetical protein ACRCWB_11625 [Enterovibrio sp.]